MSHPYAAPTSSAASRPSISEVETGPDGRWFRVSFQPGQALPPHRNARPVRVTVLEGAGVLIAPSCGNRHLGPGETVRLSPQELHEVASGPDGLVLRVQLDTSSEDAG